ncbi:hypothetical protein, partial [Clostridioides difficile]|uniref:hypothetical protein n=1 Tax=Clostridioides difficile TaxID=1496 RepID=UPI0029C45650
LIVLIFLFYYTFENKHNYIYQIKRYLWKFSLNLKFLVLLEDWLDLEYYQAKFDKLVSFA